MGKLKVVIIVPSLAIGGAENMVFQLAKTLNKEKYELKLICIGSKKDTIFEKILTDLKVETIFLNNSGNITFQTARYLWKELNKFGPDIVHTHLTACIYALPWILIHNKKLLHTIHSKPKFEFSSRIIRLMKFFYKINKAVPVAISNKIKIETVSLYGLNQEQIEVVFNPVDTNKYFHKSWSLNSDKLTFINVARLISNKNQALLIEAFSRVKNELPHTSLYIVGDGELRRELEGLVNKLDLNNSVTFTGNVDNVEHFLGVSNIFVLTSHYEGLPLSILEAMAAGLPIISTDVGGIGDIVMNNGILINDNDIEALTIAMLELATNKELRLKMSKNSQEMSKFYDVEKITDEYEKLYEKYSRR